MYGLTRKLSLFSLLYVVASLLDISFTYIYIVKLGLYSEANPFMANLVFTQPPYVLYALDMLILTLVLSVTLAYRRLVVRVGVSKVADKCWVILATAAINRLLPGIHNVILLTTGYETPLPQIIRYMYMIVKK